MSPLRPLVLAAACLLALPAVAQTVFTVSSWLPPSHTLSETQKDWCTQLEQKTAGKARCNILPRGVAAAPATFDAVRNGLADLSYTVHGYTPGRFVTTQMAEFPFLGDTAEPVSVAFQRVYARTPAMAEEHKGVKVLAVFTHGPGIVFNTKRPITKVDDLAGLKWRVGGGIVNEISKALGMNVTLKPAPESYELLSTGVMDGTLFPAESVESFKLDKTVKYATQFPGLFGRGWDKVDRRGLAFMQANNVQMTTADAAFVKTVGDKVAPLVDTWVKAAEAKGMKDPKKALADFRAEIARLQ